MARISRKSNVAGYASHVCEEIQGDVRCEGPRSPCAFESDLRLGQVLMTRAQIESFFFNLHALVQWILSSHVR